ncbi:LPS export ABC transporter permease LptG [Roseovarius indicus]|jgi:lipopolysaccharide export system permease protein|uniref:Permease n=1 Tax=Roseovarius indicus TaxID=540747 RepID=A0A0T5P965_9RHOB|nr:LPS export ABC transporter permease LptG [Roseovarius indicus]KRS17874.1 permease [Roseovarius indicus]QEW27320.1 Lipopolysaccharide export system permease protein LptG [Roseovarius indicus]SFD50375.1 lipopolysaccharide export system permease protein [Roseovarius indicus]
MTLDAYFARKFFWSVMLVFSIFLVLLALIDLVDELQDFPNLPFGSVLEIVLLNVPADNYEILPLVIVLATTGLYIRLARSSELVVVRATGRSALRSLAAPIMVALMLGILAVTMLNPIVAASSKRYNDLVNSHIGGGAAILVIASEGLWLRQGSPEGQTVIHAERASSDLTVLFDTTFIDFDPDGQPAQRIMANAARLSKGEWMLYDAKIWDLSRGENPEAAAETAETMRLSSALTQDRIIDTFGKPEYIPIWDLPRFIDQLDQAGFSARRYAMWFQMELARPLFMVALVMISAAFTMRHARLSNTGISVLSAVLLGFGLHYIRNFAQILGENGEIPILLAAWAPPVASILLATGILLHMEDG